MNIRDFLISLVSILVLLDYGALSLLGIKCNADSAVSILVLLDYGALRLSAYMRLCDSCRCFNPCFVGLWGFELIFILNYVILYYMFQSLFCWIMGL